ncbi:hypothetical protein [Methylotenera sp.]|uniref:hypothetical protein n=1 Tax=Methylotenera sp. TaxID=2051956 RepID=UPI0024891F56|nr:hypothetical protein [Methylotenera sp.]MDI1362689.1 hypothetical protein [Methylotenera sp.]
MQFRIIYLAVCGAIHGFLAGFALPYTYSLFPSAAMWKDMINDSTGFVLIFGLFFGFVFIVLSFLTAILPILGTVFLAMALHRFKPEYLTNLLPFPLVFTLLVFVTLSLVIVTLNQTLFLPNSPPLGFFVLTMLSAVSSTLGLKMVITKRL